MTIRELFNVIQIADIHEIEIVDKKNEERLEWKTNKKDYEYDKEYDISSLEKYMDSEIETTNLETIDSCKCSDAYFYDPHNRMYRECCSNQNIFLTIWIK